MFNRDAIAIAGLCIDAPFKMMSQYICHLKARWEVGCCGLFHVMQSYFLIDLLPLVHADGDGLLHCSTELLWDDTRRSLSVFWVSEFLSFMLSANNIEA